MKQEPACNTGAEHRPVCASHIPAEKQGKGGTGQTTPSHGSAADVVVVVAGWTVVVVGATVDVVVGARVVLVVVAGAKVVVVGPAVVVVVDVVVVGV